MSLEDTGIWCHLAKSEWHAILDDTFITDERPWWQMRTCKNNDTYTAERLVESLPSRCYMMTL